MSGRRRAARCVSRGLEEKRGGVVVFSKVGEAGKHFIGAIPLLLVGVLDCEVSPLRSLVLNNKLIPKSLTIYNQVFLPR